MVVPRAGAEGDTVWVPHWGCHSTQDTMAFGSTGSQAAKSCFKPGDPSKASPVSRATNRSPGDTKAAALTL